MYTNIVQDNAMVNDGSSKSHSHNWTNSKMRSVLESFAKSKSMDPLTPATWHVIRDLIRKSKVFTGAGECLLLSFNITLFFIFRLEEQSCKK